MEKTPGMVRVKNLLNHTVDFLKNWGLPENNNIKVRDFTMIFYL